MIRPSPFAPETSKGARDNHGAVNTACCGFLVQASARLSLSLVARCVRSLVIEKKLEWLHRLSLVKAPNKVSGRFGQSDGKWGVIA